MMRVLILNFKDILWKLRKTKQKRKYKKNLDVFNSFQIFVLIKIGRKLNKVLNFKLKKVIIRTTERKKKYLSLCFQCMVYGFVT